MRSRRALSSVLTGAMLLGLCAATSAAATSATAATAAADREPAPGVTAAELAERRLRADAADPVTVSTDADGDAAFVGTVGQPVADPQVPAGATPARAAWEHLDRYGAMFGVPRPGAQLQTTEVVEAPAGSHVVRFNQEVDGVPVLGGELAVSVDGDGDLESVNGETTDAHTAVPAPVEPAAAAVRTAVRVTARTHDVAPASLTASPATEWFYDPQLLGSPDPQGPRPVWRVEVSNGADIRELVLVETASGEVAAHVNQVLHALNRVVCDRGRRDSSARPCTNPVRREAAGEPAGPFGRGEDVGATFVYAGDTSELYRTVGIDLTRRIGRRVGARRELRLTVNLPGQNAFWSGREAYFSTGFGLSDDVVAHELTHGVIQRTSNLFYWYQSGAINESMADVFGEIVDQRNSLDRQNRADQQRAWLLGEDSSVGTLRDMRNPTRPALPGPRQPDRMRSRFYFADRFLRDNGGVHINSGVGNKAAFLIAAGGRFNGLTIRGLDEGQSDRRETARVYFRALQMLTSGSDYADLGRVLPQACRALLGTGRGADRITRGDCANVSRAVRATEMHLQPRTATAPEAPGCARRADSRRLFFDNIERNRRRTWAMGRLWSRAGRYATSGTDSLHGRNPARRVRNSTLTLRRNFRVPRPGRTFLRFDHSHLFEYNLRTGPRAVYFDGGRVEFSTNRGRTWRNAASLRWVNGPRQDITLGKRRPQFRGFGGDSHGYVSSRLDLSRFAGRRVRLRWVVSGDRIGRGFGWFLDDVELLHCR